MRAAGVHRKLASIRPTEPAMIRTLRPLLAAFALSILGRAEALDPNAFASLGTFNPGSAVTVNTDTLAMSGGASFTGVTSGNIAVFTFASVTLGSGITVNVSGSRCFALLSRGAMSINGTVNVSASGSAGGACGGAGQTSAAGGPGSGPGGGGGDSQGGGGAGFGGNGGGTTAGAPIGLAYGDLAVLLQGGSGGGKGTWLSAASDGGGGGGAMELAAITTLSILGSTQLRAQGAAGFVDSNDDGGGGGSGGGIYLHGGSVSLASGAQLLANGGNGGNGGPNGIGGGGGGGGRIRVENVSSSSATVNVAGGAASTGGFGNGLAGAAGVSQVILSSPEIAVSGNGANIADGDTTPSSTDHTDFGSQSVASGTIVRTFTIANPGNANLTIAGVNLSGSHAADFSVTAAPASPVAAAGSTTFQITFNPSASGTRSATVTINNNDGDEGTFDFAIQGTGTDPEIAVSGNGANINDGDATPSSTDHTDFGSQSVASGTIVRTFTITNAGNANLTVGSLNLGGAHAGDFSIIATPTTPIAPAGSTTFQISFNPGASGLRTATLEFATNDADESLFDFAIHGTGVDPDIAVYNGNSTAPADERADGIGALVLADTNLNGPATLQTFTLRNVGNATLSGLALTLNGAQASDFSLGSLGATTLAAGQTTSFDVSFLPTAVGLREAGIAIASNDPDEQPFDILLRGTGRSADLQISKSNQESGLLPGRDSLYVIQVLNAGPGPVGSTQIADDLPAALTNPEWTCTSTPAGLCPSSSGSGDLLHTTGTLPAGALIEYLVVATPSGTPPAFISNTASVTNGDGSDPNTANNSATDTDPVVTEGIYGDSFETGATLLRPTIAR